MIPFVADEVLKRNPQFNLLITDLVKNKVNTDATIKDPAKAKQRNGTDADLNKLRKDLAKRKLLENYLRNLCARDNSLPPELVEVVDVTVSLLYPRAVEQSSDLSAELRRDDLEKFKESVPLIARALSAHIEQDMTILAEVAFPKELADNQDERIDMLPGHMDSILQDIRRKREQLVEARKATISSLDAVLGSYEEVIEKLIKIIEQTKCGIVARASKAQAKHLALVSEGFEGKLKVLYFEALDQIYSPEMLGALDNYNLHLKDTKVRLLQRHKTAESDLKKYDSAGKEMKELVKNYEDIAKQIDMVTVDIKRLGGTV